MAAVVSRFSILHITAPGQRSNCPNLPTDFQYPSMEQLSEMVEYVCHHYGVAFFVGLGTGLGANVLVRLAFRRPKLVEGLILFNCNITSAGWVEWAYHKMNMKSLKKSTKFPESVVEYLLWHHIGSRLSPDTLSLASIYKQHFMTQV
ncbi:protein NDRG3 [Eurytemora carolleeae]|uniref:protein NDRG3 n=1 Tax=Eurytemora carolleeae TaxID=1294199 RepID=UPI000C787367|nr:protein NDRG3 [Eurytemora carolleeae]|eukprot:XP_023330190.1 protein NDRG3-like [Eurytemora affinis]